MSNIAFQNFGKVAGRTSDDTVIASRYEFQKKQEKNIFCDLMSKLRFNSDDIVLDIGCGSGNLSIPLSFVCHQVHAIDHEAVLKRLRAFQKTFTFIAETFLIWKCLPKLLLIRVTLTVCFII